DYRAGATIDDEHDRADLAAGRKIACPTLALWSETFVGRGKTADPLAVWRQYAHDVRGFPVGCGHFVPEEAPDAAANPIAEFLAGWSAGWRRHPSHELELARAGGPHHDHLRRRRADSGDGHDRGAVRDEDQVARPREAARPFEHRALLGLGVLGPSE